MIESLNKHDPMWMDEWQQKMSGLVGKEALEGHGGFVSVVSEGGEAKLDDAIDSLLN